MEDVFERKLRAQIEQAKLEYDKFRARINLAERGPPIDTDYESMLEALGRLIGLTDAYSLYMDTKQF